MDLDFQPANQPPKPDKPMGPAPAPAPTPGSVPPPPPPPPPPTVIPPASSEPVIPPMGPTPPPPPLPPLKPAGHRSSKFLYVLLALLLLVALVAVVMLVVLPSLSPETTLQTSVPSLPESTQTETSTLPSSSTPAGRDSTRKQDLKTIETLLAAYFADNQAYPVVSPAEKLNDPASIVAAVLVPKYAASLPKDPLDPEFWYGYESKDGKGYELTARLEVSTDPDAKLVGSKYLYTVRK